MEPCAVASDTKDGSPETSTREKHVAKRQYPHLESRTEVGSVLEGSCSIAFDGPYERWQVGADGIASTSSYLAAISCGHPLAVSPNGRWLVTLACERIGRNFDESEWRMVYGDAPYCKTCLA
jgi:hypothetical protein